MSQPPNPSSEASSPAPPAAATAGATRAPAGKDPSAAATASKPAGGAAAATASKPAGEAAAAEKPQPPAATIAPPRPVPSAGQGGPRKPAAIRAAAAPRPAPSPGFVPGEQSPGGPLVSRRGFFSLATLAWLSFTGAVSLGFVGLLRFLFPNVLYEPPMVFKAGFPDEFVVGKVDERFKNKYGVWIVRNDEGLYALSTVCTHLGCTPNWLEGEQKFKCPCHGSGFYKSGINFEGPAPRPLERYKIGFADDGQILIDKRQKYQQEKGQWEDPDSFLKLS